jgi:Fe-S cluster assembly protein SufD
MAQTLASPDSYVADFGALAKGRSGRGPAWLQDLRKEAFSRFRELGFPTARRGNEKWKYTNVGPIADAAFSFPLDVAQDVDVAGIRRVAPWHDSWATLVFVNGCYSPALSTPPAAPTGASVANLADAVRTNGEAIQRHLTRHATFDDDAFAALNTSFLWDGAFVHVPDSETLASPLHLVYLTTAGSQPVASYPRTLIVAGADSKLTVIETFASLSGAPDFTDAVTEIVLGDGARMEHYRLLLQSEDAFHVGMGRVYQGRDSTFTSTSFATGAAIARNDLRVVLDGPGGSCFLNGLYLTSGTQHVDNYINIDHAKPHTTSRLYYRGILDGSSRAVFGGMVLVRPGAAKADAHQEDKNLLLSEDAEVDSKPSLEIYADDVKCGHGATAGAVAEDAIFYMRSRGLDLETATAFLIKGFASRIIDTVKVRPLRAHLDKLLSRTLRGVRFAQRS